MLGRCDRDGGATQVRAYLPTVRAGVVRYAVVVYVISTVLTAARSGELLRAPSQLIIHLVSVQMLRLIVVARSESKFRIACGGRLVRVLVNGGGVAHLVSTCIAAASCSELFPRGGKELWNAENENKSGGTACSS